jgi:hypothetical protein
MRLQKKTRVSSSSRRRPFIGNMHTDEFIHESKVYNLCLALLMQGHLLSSFSMTNFMSHVCSILLENKYKRTALDAFIPF